MKKVLCLFFIFLFVSCSTQKEVVPFYSREIIQDNVFKMKEDKYLVLYYSPTCPACKDSLKILNSKYEENSFSIYLLNINNSDVVRTKEIVSNINVDNPSNIKIYSTPTLFFIENKVIKLEARGLEKMREENFFIYFL